MREIIGKNVKTARRYIMPTSIIVSSFFSLFLAFGLAIGYVGTDMFLRKFVNTGRINPVVVKLKGNWNLHLHHWLMGILTILAVYFMGLLFSIPLMFVGVVIGLVVHDLHTDDVWHQVIYKKNRD